MTIDAELTRIIAELIEAGVPLVQARDQFEQKYLNVAMTKTNGNITKAAQQLGVHRNTLMNKMRREANRQ